MNLISNCCLGAFIYEMQNEEFNNPFMWTMTNTDSFISLMEHYDNINWDSIDFDKFQRSDGEKCYSIIVENKVRINYTHYLQGKKEDHELVKGRDVYDWRAYEYAFKKYQKRTERLLKKKEKPVFLILAELKGKYDYNLENLKRICEAKSRYKLLIITSFEELKKYENERIKIIIDKHPKNESGCFTEQFANMYKNQIVEFINE